MASSNRHWPSMFKSKPHHHDIIPSVCRSGPYATSVLGCEERSPEPKPRWNPKPEQIRILEAIFNSGMVNPPRDEISKIRAQLQEYGQVGDANVFYWFQNRKSRSKHKNRHQPLSKTNNTTTSSTPTTTTTTPSSAAVVATSSSSSSSEKPSPRGSSKRKAGGGSSSTGFTGGSSSSSTKLYMDVVGTNSNSPTGSVNQSGNYFNHNNEHFIQPQPQPEPYFFPVQQSGAIASGVFGGPNGLFFSELQGGGGGGGVECGVTGLQGNMNNGLDGNNNNGIHGGGFSGLLLGEMIGGSKKDEREDDLGKFRFHQEFGFLATTPLSSECLNVGPPQLSSSTPTANMMLTSFSQGQVAADDVDPGLLLGQSPSTIVAPAKSTVFINDVAFEVPAGAFNVRDAFGEDAVLVHCSGQPVLTDDWGSTSLQHGGFYYLVRTLPSGGPVYDKNESTTADLLLGPDQFPFHL